MRDRGLWARVSTYSFDANGRSGQFARRLARRGGWTMDYAHAVIEEYRRYLYLSVVSPAPLAPSPAVDLAWDLHMSDPQDYWHRLCPEVLDQPLDHVPMAGDDATLATYNATRDLYRHEFHDAPPVVVWPHPQDEWRKQRWSLWVVTACGAAFVGMSILPTPQSMVTPSFVFFAMISALLVMYRSLQTWSAP